MIGPTILHYDVLQELGRGGMGVVYLAQDTRLDRKVALKFLAEKLQAHATAKTRLIREAKSAAAIDHPYICRVYDIGEHDGETFLVLEYVEGVTLKHRLEGGLLPLREALRISLEIAEALDEAHKRGLVHRDLKPANIMLTSSNHSKVMDFGVAKQVRSSDRPDSAESTLTALTATDAVAGSLSYMSPEQLRGKDVDSRSDIFSFGLVLYEMLTGVHPFRRADSLATAAAISTETPPPPSRYRRDLPELLEHTLTKMLANDPDQRYQSVHEVLTNLRGLTERTLEESRARTDTGAGTAASRKVLKFALLGLAVTIAAAALALWFRGPGEVPEVKDLVVMGDFGNFTRDPLLGDSLSLAFRVALEESKQMRIVPASQVRQALVRMGESPDSEITRSMWVEICRREGAKALATASISRIGSVFQLSAQIIDPGSDQAVFTETATAATESEIVDALGRLANSVRRGWGESRQIVEQGRRLEKLTTKDLVALEAYSRGIDKLASGNSEAAIGLFLRALERDPEFATAYAKLGVIYRSTDRDLAQALNYFETALQHSDRLTDREKLYVEGWIATSKGPPAEMVRVWTLFSEQYPEEIVGHHNLGMSLWIYENRFAQAAQAFEKAVEIRDPLRLYSLQSLGYCQLALGNFADAIRRLREAWEINRNPLGSGLADAYVVLRQYDDARDFLDRTSQDQEPFQRVHGLMRRASLHIDRGQFRRAIEVAREAGVHAKTGDLAAAARASDSTVLAGLLYGSSSADLAEALNQAVSDQLEQLGSPRMVTSSALPYLALLGKVAARHSQESLALEILEAIEARAEGSRFPIWIASSRILKGEVELLQGNGNESVELFMSAQSYADLFQGHESLARAYRLLGDWEKAAREYGWLIEHRGQAFSECAFECAGRDFNVVDWAVAHVRLAEVWESMGNHTQAMSSYESFTEHWRDADEGIPLLREATERLLDLRNEEASTDSADLLGHHPIQEGQQAELRVQSGLELLFGRQGNGLGEIAGMDVKPVFQQDLVRIGFHAFPEFVVRRELFE